MHALIWIIASPMIIFGINFRAKLGCIGNTGNVFSGMLLLGHSVFKTGSLGFDKNVHFPY